MSIKYNPNRSFFTPQEELKIKTIFFKENKATPHLGDYIDFLKQIPDKFIYEPTANLILARNPLSQRWRREYETN